MMAYFPNATSAEMAMEDNCFQCKNRKIREDEDTEGCPISDVHYRGNYIQCKNSDIKAILEILWPTKNNHPGKCSMFEPNGECRGQLTFNSEPS